MPLTHCPIVLAASNSNIVLPLAIAFVAVALFMMLVILIQKPKGGGLSGAFGGAGGSDTSFVGAKVGDFLTILTVTCFILFLLLGMGLTWAINPTQNRSNTPTIAPASDTGAGATTGENAAATSATPAEATSTPDAPASQATEASDNAAATIDVDLPATDTQAAPPVSPPAPDSVPQTDSTPQ
ncbi:MAG: preprotein translocase subunit SecG [Algisphaera sp.]